LYADNPTGNYTIKVTVEDIGAAPDVTYYFEGADKQHPALEAVCAAIAAESKSGLTDALLSNASVLGLGKAAFEALGEDGKTAVIDVLLDKEYTLPTGYASEGDIEILANSISKLQSDYLAAIALG
ncbi:MAG: hypothetical protein IJ454_00160, partial [Clostridia bacterium]|nr:hypothetical protein [Clostridia bacterium]